MQPTRFPPQDLEVAVHQAIGRLGRVGRVSREGKLPSITHPAYSIIMYVRWIGTTPNIPIRNKKNRTIEYIG
jgi:hypothetical protein